MSILLSKYQFICLLLFVSFNGVAQTSFTLKGIKSKQPIPYASVLKENKIYGTADSLGIFHVKDGDLGKHFTISSVGYETLDGVLKGDAKIIFLSESVKQLQEVKIVKRKGSKTVKLGKAKKGDFGICARMEDQVGLLGKYFSSGKNEGLFVDKIKFNALSSKNGQIINFLLYSVNENGEPDKILTQENILCALKKGNHTNEIDLKQYGIEMPKEGIFVVFQYLLVEQNKQYSSYNKEWFFYEPSLDASVSEGYTDSWFNDGSWKKAENYSLNFQLLLMD
ncbi:hypothetical protein [Flavobacterium pedocola]